MAKITHFDQGDIWTPQATFTVAGTPTDPTTITVRLKEPDGTVTVLGPAAGGTGGGGIVRVSTGVFNTLITLDDAGYWFARFEGTGAAAASEDQQAIVDPSEFFESAQLGSRALVGLAETKDWLQQQNIDTSGDLELARVINDVSERFHDEAAREFKAVGTNPQVRLFDVDYLACQHGIVHIGDLAAAPTLVRVIGTDWVTPVGTVTDYLAEPVNREAWAPIRQLRFNPTVSPLTPGQRVEVTGTFGFPSVPGNVRQAVLDGIAAVVDRDVEHYRQDLGTSAIGQGVGGGGSNVVVFGGRPLLLSLPPGVLATAQLFRDPLVG